MSEWRSGKPCIAIRHSSRLQRAEPSMCLIANIRFTDSYCRGDDYFVQRMADGKNRFIGV
jgi:hypothetical protein